jgi:hypothetical protein
VAIFDARLTAPAGFATWLFAEMLVSAFATISGFGGWSSKGKPKETKMNKSILSAMALTVALSTGGLLLQHPVSRNLAPGAYADILIVEDSTPRDAPAGEKSAVPTDVQQSGASGRKMTGDDEGSRGDANKGNPPRNPE